MLPLSEKLGGVSEVLRLDLAEALNYRDAISERGEFDEYYMWLADKRREQEKEDGESPGEKHLDNPKLPKRSKFDVNPNSDKPMQVLMPAEKNKAKVDNAMQSVGRYTNFLKSRGFGGAGFNGM